MREGMTLEKIQEMARDLGLEEEVERILRLASALQLQPLMKENYTFTVPFQLAGTTIFRLGEDYESWKREKKLLLVAFPFHTWKRDWPSNDRLEALREHLLETQPRLDEGGARQSVRLELTESSIDGIIAAACTVYGELSRYLLSRPG